MAVVIDDKSEPGSWQHALDRGCLSGRVVEQLPKQLPPAHNESPSPRATDVAAKTGADAAR